MNSLRFSFPGTREPGLLALEPRLQAWLDDRKAEISAGRIEASVRGLPAPRNRQQSPEAMAQAETILQGSFAEVGWQVERRPFSLTNYSAYQGYGETTAEYTRMVVYPRLEGSNLLAIKEGLDARRAVLVMAHLDTVRDSPGANDNTASVAALLELARLLAPFRFHRTILLAVTDMEEIGLVGGKVLAQALCQERSLRGLINYETMAYIANEPGTQSMPPGIELLYPAQAQRIRERGFRGEFTALIYNGPASGLAASFAAALVYLAGPHAAVLLRDPNDLPLVGGLLRRAVPAVRNFARSDHLPFWQRGVPGLFVTDTANFRYRYYHTPQDTPEKLDYARLAAIVGATAAALAQAAGLEA